MHSVSNTCSKWFTVMFKRHCTMVMVPPMVHQHNSYPITIAWLWYINHWVQVIQLGCHCIPWEATRCDVGVQCHKHCSRGMILNQLASPLGLNAHLLRTVQIKHSRLRYNYHNILYPPITYIKSTATAIIALCMGQCLDIACHVV